MPRPAARAAPQDLSQRLLEWYARERRELPWRASRDPYAIWVSEMMLQQTQVSTVLGYYERWMRRFPSLSALADADEPAVLHAWQGLGYYSRAKNLLRAARAVRDEYGGRVPDDPALLRQLPGVGPYTAGAIASIAFDRPAPLVDGNVERVLVRHRALRGDPKRDPLKGELWKLAERLLPTARPGDFNQALMELGALICLPRAPRCADCPIASDCAARVRGIAEQLPEARARPKPSLVRMAAAVALRRGRLAVLQLPEDAARWAGMWQFPNLELAAGESPDQAARRALSAAGLVARSLEPLCSVRHSVTRYRITLEVYRAEGLRGRLLREREGLARWLEPGKLEALAMPAAHRRIAKLIGPRT